MTRPASYAEALLPGPIEERLEGIVVDEDRTRARRRFDRICKRIEGRADLVDACCEAVQALHRRGVISDDVRIYLAKEFMDLWPFEGADSELRRLEAEATRIGELIRDRDERGRDAPKELVAGFWDAVITHTEWKLALEVRRLRVIGLDDVAELLQRDTDFMRRSRLGEAQLWSTIPLPIPEPPPALRERISRARIRSVRTTVDTVADAPGTTCVTDSGLAASDVWPDPRPKDQQLEEAIRNPDRAQSRVMLSAINDLVLEQPQLAPGWIEGAHALAKRSVISRDMLVYFTGHLLRPCTLMDTRVDPELVRLAGLIGPLEEECRAGAGLPEDHPQRSAVRSLDDAFNARVHALSVQRLRNHGFSEMADLLETRPEEFSRRYAEGHAELEAMEAVARE